MLDTESVVQRALDNFQPLPHRAKVLLTYIVYPFAIASYFRKALANRIDVDLKVAGPYTSTWIPWNFGMNLPKKYDCPPDISLSLPPDIREFNYEIIKAQLGDWIPDIIIQVDAGLHFKYKPSDGLVVTVATDPHVLVLNYDVPRGYSDKFYNMQLCYSQPGDIYLPYAYSTYDHYPSYVEGQDARVVKDLDAVLLGLQYPQRIAWREELERRGVKVHFENGPVFDEARAIYNRARIGLNWSTLLDMNARVFELPAMKLCPVINRVPDLANMGFQEGVHYLGFSDLGEAVEKVVWAKEHPEEAQRMAQDAYENVQGETYDQRVEVILKDAGLI